MGFMKTLTRARSSIIRVLPLMRESRVPVGLKVGTVIMAVLIISPLDIFGDIPVLGIFDDAALLTMLCMGFVALGERALTSEVIPYASAPRRNDATNDLKMLE
jgi:uncharacterized membrane protein YkvA (DUF1232 family)